MLPKKTCSKVTLFEIKTIKESWKIRSAPSWKLQSEVCQFFNIYNSSVAKCLEDLRRIDRDVFSVSKDLDVILGKHYSKGFGFVICSFDSTQKAHPIGFPISTTLTHSISLHSFSITRWKTLCSNKTFSWKGTFNKCRLGSQYLLFQHYRRGSRKNSFGSV